MKSTAKFSIFPAQVGPDVFHALCALHQEGRGKFGFNCELEEGTDKLVKILNLLRANGFTPWHKFGRKTDTQFDYRVERTFTEKELDAAEFLILKPKVYVEETGTANGRGDPKVRWSSLQKSDFDIGFLSLWQRLLVSSRFRKLAHSAGLMGLEYHKINLVGTYGDAEATAEFFELRSRWKMPLVSAECSLVDADGKTFMGDYAKGCFLSEGCYEEPFLRYHRKALAQIGATDLLFTAERFGNYADIALPYPVVTQPFYKFCQTHKFKLEWQPVIIHE